MNNVGMLLSGLIRYPASTTDDDIRGIASDLVNGNTMAADITYEEEFRDLVNPKGKVVKMSKSRYIDDFFRTGAIQLGTIKYYQSIDDPEQGDSSEGSMLIVGKNDFETAFVQIESGYNNYAFCCYDGEPNPEVIKRFGYNDYFIIHDVEGFMYEVSKVLNSNLSFRSRCIYKRDKVIVGKISNNFNFNIMSNKLAQLVGMAKYFIKKK